MKKFLHDIEGYSSAVFAVFALINIVTCVDYFVDARYGLGTFAIIVSLLAMLIAFMTFRENTN